MISVEEFMQFHVACPKGREWALAECRTMDDVWQKAKGEWLIWVATRPGVATPKEQRLLAVHAARSVPHMLASPGSLRAIEVAERHAHGLATDDELAAASAAARAATWDAARAAAWVAARAASDAAWAAADAAWAAADAARAAAWVAAWAASDAAWAASAAARDDTRDDASAARDAARAAVWAATWEDFAQWTRTHIKPDFTRLVSRDG